jgi:hypothetical protein
MKLPGTMVRATDPIAPMVMAPEATKNKRDGDAPPVNTKLTPGPMDIPADERKTKKSDATP